MVSKDKCFKKQIASVGRVESEIYLFPKQRYNTSAIHPGKHVAQQNLAYAACLAIQTKFSLTNCQSR